MKSSKLTREDKHLFLTCYFIFMISGSVNIMIGSILPYLKEAYHLSYRISGFLVSFHSIGNLITCFFAGILPFYFGRRKSVFSLSLFGILAFILLFTTGNPLLLLSAYFLTGINRGAINNFNNTMINEAAPGKAWALNILHASSCAGSVFVPYLILFFTNKNPENWKCAVLAELFFLSLASIMLLFMKIPNNYPAKSSSEKSDYGFFKEKRFLLACGMLFTYLAAEQAIIGWLVTYLKDSGIMSNSLSQIMNSVLWLIILIGRLLAACFTRFIKNSAYLFYMAIGYLFFFVLLLFAHTAFIASISIVGIGFFMAGFYPTTVADVGDILKKYPISLSVIITVGGFGSILMPIIVGFVANTTGILGGMATIVVAVFLMFLLTTINFVYNKKNGR